MNRETTLDRVVSTLSEECSDKQLPLTYWQVYDMARNIVDALGLDPMSNSRLEVPELRGELRVHTGVFYVFSVPTKTAHSTRIPPWHGLPPATIIELRTQPQRS